MSFVGSLKIGKSSSSDAANFVFFSTLSVLAAKYATSNVRSASPLARSDWHSAVQPPVKAFGNHATTTGRTPVNSRRRYVRPSDAASSKSGAASPGDNSGLRRNSDKWSLDFMPF
ncbi:MAG TPA: hypothetical protein VFA59_06890 [Vicinamibacterales bacterium]|nr:hypothetical protein [Vicinamibacterales bacterium]